MHSEQSSLIRRRQKSSTYNSGKDLLKSLGRRLSLRLPTFHAIVEYKKTLSNGIGVRNAAIINESYRSDTPALYKVKKKLEGRSDNEPRTITIRHRATLQPRVPEPSKRHLVPATRSRSILGMIRQRISFKFKSTADSASL